MNPRLHARDAYSIVRCPALFLMGEHKAVVSYLVREPVRGGCGVGAPAANLGMRLILAH